MGGDVAPIGAGSRPVGDPVSSTLGLVASALVPVTVFTRVRLERSPRELDLGVSAPTTRVRSVLCGHSHYLSAGYSGRVVRAQIRLGCFVSEPRATVVFHTHAFNTTEVRPHFINPGCFGDDMAHWFAERLCETGAQVTDQPGQEDFGWYIDFEVAGTLHSLVIGYRPDGDEGGVWIVTVERARGLLGSLLGRRDRGIAYEAVERVHAVLSRAPEISIVRWHHTLSFRAGDEDQGSDQP